MVTIRKVIFLWQALASWRPHARQNGCALIFTNLVVLCLLGSVTWRKRPRLFDFLPWLANQGMVGFFVLIRSFFNDFIWHLDSLFAFLA